MRRGGGSDLAVAMTFILPHTATPLVSSVNGVVSPPHYNIDTIAGRGLLFLMFDRSVKARCIGTSIIRFEEAMQDLMRQNLLYSRQRQAKING